MIKIVYKIKVGLRTHSKKKKVKDCKRLNERKSFVLLS